MSPSRSPDRRQFLALTAAASLAGCNDRVPGTGPKEIDAEELASVVARPAPTVPETLPVAIDPDVVEEQVEEARRMLAEVPAPLSESDVPNGVIRERLNRGYESVREYVGSVDEAKSPFARLRRGGHARADAREVLATWRAIDAGQTVEDVRKRAPEVRDDVEAFARQWSYVGDDPVRAVRVHGAIESDLVGARNWADLEDRAREDGPFAVGELATDLERARVDLATMEHVFEQFRESLDRQLDLQDRLEAVGRSLSDRADQRAASLPEVDADKHPTELVDRDIDKTAGVWALAELHREARRQLWEIDSGDDPSPWVASTVLDRHRTLTVLQAFDRLQSRLADGEDLAVESAGDVAAMREEAVTAIETARQADSAPGLVRSVLPQFALRVQWADDDFESQSESVPAPYVARDASEYVVVAAVCHALPAVSGSVATTLRNG